REHCGKLPMPKPSKASETERSLPSCSAVVFDGVNWPISVSTHLQRREDRWVIVDLVGKGGHVRTVPVPGWVKQFLDEWFTTAEVTTGKLFRCVCRSGTVWGNGMTEKVVWHVVKMYAKKLEMPQLAPHDSSEVMRPILSRSWRRIGTDPVLVGSCVRPNNRALSAANSNSAKPLTTDSASNPSFELKRAGSSPAPFQLP